MQLKMMLRTLTGAVAIGTLCLNSALAAPAEDVNDCLSSGGGEKRKGATTAAVVGGLLGVLAGNQIGGDKGKVIGAIAGSVIGWQIGKQLNKNERARVCEQFAMTLETAEPNESITYDDPEGRVTTTMTVTDTSSEKEELDTLWYSRVDQDFAFDPVDSPYRVYTESGGTVNLRATPNTRVPPIGKLRTGEVLHAFGAIKEQPWMLVGRDGVAMGYVHDSLLLPHTNTAENDAPAREMTFEVSEDELPQRVQNANSTFDLDYIEGLSDQEFAVVSGKFELELECRTMDMEITFGDQSESRKVNACKQTDGSWQTVSEA